MMLADGLCPQKHWSNLCLRPCFCWLGLVPPARKPIHCQRGHFCIPTASVTTAQCLTIDGKDVFIYSGAFHYFRCPKELWPDRFQKIKDAGFNCVETYVAWNWCEQEMPADTNDFSKVKLTDLDDFLTIGGKIWTLRSRPARPVYLRGVGHRRLSAMAVDEEARRAAARRKLAAQRRPGLSRVVQTLV